MESNKTSESLPMTGSEQAKYVYSGRVMLTSVILLFLVCFIIVCFHTYARWFLSRRSRRQNGGAATTAAAADIEKAAKKGLSPTQLKSLPVFIYASSATSSPKSPAPECAVCLSEFQETEPVRLLPSCKHCFHLECIDMWFYSHSNCPLCRAPAVPAVPCSPLPENLIPADVCDNGSIRPVPDSSGSRVLCPGSETGCSSSLPARLRGGDRSKLPELLAVVVEIPPTNDGGNRLQ